MTTVHQERSRPEAPLELQLKGYRLATAEILYRMPDHPSLLQTFIWQHYDLAPDYPELRKFLAFWAEKIEGKLFSVRVGRTEILSSATYAHVGGVWQLH
jgi:uncharacterized protein Usg